MERAPSSISPPPHLINPPILSSKLVTTRDVLLALLATLLLWSAVTLLTTFRADLDLTGPSFLNGCLTPLLLFILYLLLWLGYCRCRSSSPPGHQHHHHHHQTPSNSPPPVDFEQHLIMVTALEVVIVLSVSSTFSFGIRILKHFFFCR